MFEKVSRFDERVADPYETAEQLAPINYSAFGEQELQQIEIIRNDASAPAKEREQKIHEVTSRSRGELEELAGSLRYLSDSDAPPIRTAFTNKKFLQKVEQRFDLDKYLSETYPDYYEEFGGDERGYAFALACAAEDGSLPDDIYLEMLALHREAVQQETNSFNEMLPRYLEDAETRLYELFGQLNMPNLRERFRLVVPRLRIVIRDGFVTELAERSGQYIPAKSEINVTTGLDDAQREIVLDHELLHALSGVTLLCARENDAIEHQRTGLYYHRNKVGRFYWLNEGVTAMLGRKIRRLGELEDTSFSNEYGYYRELIDAVMHAGAQHIDEQLLYRAYFEDYDLRHPARIPDWKRLNNAITLSYKPGFLIKLDRYVRSHNVIDAQKLVRKGDWKTL
jgi:hypothetical protein